MITTCIWRNVINRATIPYRTYSRTYVRLSGRVYKTVSRNGNDLFSGEQYEKSLWVCWVFVWITMYSRPNNQRRQPLAVYIIHYSLKTSRMSIWSHAHWITRFWKTAKNWPFRARFIVYCEPKKTCHFIFEYNSRVSWSFFSSYTTENKNE